MSANRLENQIKPGPARPPRRILRWLLPVALFVLVVGLAGAAYLLLTGVSLAQAELAHDFDGSRAVKTAGQFSVHDPAFHCVVTLNNPQKNTRVRVSWTALDAGGAQNYLIDEEERVVDGQPVNDFSISATRDWPRGKYQAEVFLNGQSVRRLDFTVQ